MYEEGSFTKKEYLKICHTGSKLDTLYGQAKVHKPVENNCPSVRPIFSATDTSIYEWE